MNHFKRSQIGGVVSALLLCVASAAHAQQDATSNSAGTDNAGSSPNVVIGPPGLEDFQLEPRERLVTQPAPQPQRPATDPARPVPDAQRPAQRQNDLRPGPTAPTREAAPSIETAPAPTGEIIPPIVAEPETALPPASEVSPAPAPAATAEPEEENGSWWPYLALLGLLVVGAAWLGRRRRQSEETATPSEPVAVAAPEPRRQPVPRPWLELELKAKRASFTDTEWIVQFELSVSNTGQSVARDLRIDVMLFNAGKEQDKEIGAFFRTAGRESTKLKLPGIQPGATGIIDGEVAMPLAEMRAMKLSDRTLFIPVVGVNVLYDWGEERIGQTAKSYVVGRELQEPSEKMGAFRVDLGPRIWRTVGQRQHKLARRF
ncbi:MAG TPA: hypothetical protein VFO69_11350 [Allosphingosinicella sp.]|nr:hypothetical protein [Allosphingosinicella sp.]